MSTKKSTTAEHVVSFLPQDMSPPSRDIVGELRRYIDARQKAKEAKEPKDQPKQPKERTRRISVHGFPRHLHRWLGVWAADAAPRRVRPGDAAAFALMKGPPLLLKLPGSDAIRDSYRVVQRRGDHDDLPWFDFPFELSAPEGKMPKPYGINISPDEGRGLDALVAILHLSQSHASTLAIAIMLLHLPSMDGATKGVLLAELRRFRRELARRATKAQRLRREAEARRTVPGFEAGLDDVLIDGGEE